VAKTRDVLDTMGFLHQFPPPGIAALRQDMVTAGRAMPVLEADYYAFAHDDARGANEVERDLVSVQAAGDKAPGQ
jgi:hypothetical protein